MNSYSTYYCILGVVCLLFAVGVGIYLYCDRRNGLAPIRTKKPFWSFLYFFKKAKPEVREVATTESATDASVSVVEAEVVAQEEPVSEVQPEPSAPVAQPVAVQEISIAMEVRLQSLEKDVADQKRLQNEHNALLEERRLLLKEHKLQQKAETLKLKQEQVARKAEQKAERAAVKAQQKADQQAARAVRKQERKVRWSIRRQKFSKFCKAGSINLAKTIWFILRALWVFVATMCLWLFQSNNIRAKALIVLMLVVTIWSGFHLWDQYQLRKQYSFVEEAVDGIIPMHNALLQKDELPDAQAFFGIQPKAESATSTADKIFSESALVKERPNETAASKINADRDSALGLVLWYAVGLPFLWLAVLLYWVASWREEWLEAAKNFLEGIKKSIAERKQGKVASGDGGGLFSRKRHTGGLPARVLGEVSVATAGVPSTVVVEPATKERGGFESLVVKALAAEEVIEYAMKFITWAIKKSKEKKS